MLDWSVRLRVYVWMVALCKHDKKKAFTLIIKHEKRK